MGGRAHPNFKVIIESSGMDDSIELHLRDVRIRVIPAGPNRRGNDQCIQLRGLVRVTGALETRANLALSSNGMELGTAVRMETKPFEDGDTDRKNYVLNGGKTGRSRVTQRTLDKLRKKNA